MCKILMVMILFFLACSEAKTSKITPRVPKSLMQNGCKMTPKGYLICQKIAPKRHTVISFNR